MKPRTEKFLYLFLWSAEALIRPTFRNVTESFEGWAYRKGLLRHLATLERKEFLERQSSSNRLYRLTDKGRIHALGGRDPQLEWARRWDGWWRLVSFDVPNVDHRVRRRLRYYLRSRGLGLLQRSLWATPHRLDEEARLLKSTNPDVKSLIFFEARPCARESDMDIVSNAWNFERINKLYRNYLTILAECPAHRSSDNVLTKTVLKWAEEERLAWKTAVSADPLLPRVLLPRGYLGERAWNRRVEALQRVGRIVKMC